MGIPTPTEFHQEPAPVNFWDGSFSALADDGTPCRAWAGTSGSAEMATADDIDDQPLLTRRRAPEAELDFTSMIDVTFLLLIFFMVGAKMETTKPVDLPVASAGQGIEVSKATPFILRQDTNQVLDREPIVELENGLPASLAEVRQIVRTRADEGRREFIIRAERRVPNGLVQALARAVQETEGTRFYVAVEEGK